MKTPVEIVRETLFRHGAKSLISDALDEDIVAALEAEGYVFAEYVELENGDVALRAAPKWTKG